MDLSIIIVNYKEPGFLRQCLKGIQRARLKLPYEVIVVDNASGDRSVGMVREHFPDVVLLPQNRNLGFAAGNNVGLRRAAGRYVLLLNADIAVFEGALERLMTFLNDHPKVGMIAPQLLNPDQTIQTTCYRFPSPLIPMLRRTPLGMFGLARAALRQYLMLDWDHHEIRPIEWALGACLMVRRRAIEEVGLLDEQFFMYFEDVDWCRRFWEAGWPVIYLPTVALVHYHQRMSAENPGLNGVFQKLTRIHIQSGLKYFRKYFRKPNPIITTHEILV
ncbi:MAG: glycosyltransferase family 2 protein [Candidatus Kerfeldbacteria bacterium]|nr:glycosyltransferase family 2 protein [Candidatus Kerfeldbacteria bacterium]